MAIAVRAVVGSSTYNLTDGAPFRLESAEGLGAPPVQRYSQQGPLDNQAIDSGYHVAPRTVTLALNFAATSGSALDSYRATLGSAFRPSGTAPIYLQVIRNDGGTRQLTCYPVGEYDIPLVAENRPGNLHRSVVQLRAADPYWTAAESTVGSIVGSVSPWYLAGGAIGTASVLEAGEWPTQGQQWTYAGTVTGAWSLALQSGSLAPTTGMTLFAAGTATRSASVYAIGDTLVEAAGTAVSYLSTGSYFTSGTESFIMTYGTPFASYWMTYIFRNGTIANYAGPEIDIEIDGAVTGRRWRSNAAGSAASYWSADIPKYAVYSGRLSDSVVATLHSWMANTATIAQTTIVNPGNVAAYPLITIHGPIVSPRIHNVTGGKWLDLLNFALAAGSVLTIDLRTGNKQIYDSAGSSRMDAINALADDLTDWSLLPSPAASGGTNTIILYGGSINSSTRVEFSFMPLYWSF